MVGFAERGEAVVNATSEPNAQFFSFNEDRSISDYPEQVLQGEYQLEIRRGSEFGSQDNETIGFLDPNLPGVPNSYGNYQHIHLIPTIEWFVKLLLFPRNSRLIPSMLWMVLL